MIYQSAAMERVKTLATKFAKTNLPVFIYGESGTGKELVCDLIYNLSRQEKPLIKINCGAIPKDLVESELFGYKKGAFTGANKDKEGLFEIAKDGVLFLDELGELPLFAQVKLLRVLQDRKAWSVGGLRPYDVCCKIIAATNMNPEVAIEQGTLRLDLYHRLNILRINMPTLRERREDIPILARFFLEKFKQQEGMPTLRFDEDVLGYLQECEWSGNVRQLENCILQAAVLSEGIVRIEDFNNRLSTEKTFDVELVEKDLIADCIKKCDGNISKAAKKLGMHRQTIYRKAKKYNAIAKNDNFFFASPVDMETKF